MDVVCRSKTNYQVEISADRHQFIADEPLGTGDDAGPTPYDLLLGALGACTVMTVEMYAKRKNWPLDGVEITLRTYKIYARDCMDCESDAEARVDVIERQLHFRGELTGEQIERLTEIADKCPVHRTLSTEIKIRTLVRKD